MLRYDSVSFTNVREGFIYPQIETKTKRDDKREEENDLNLNLKQFTNWIAFVSVRVEGKLRNKIISKRFQEFAEV